MRHNTRCFLSHEPRRLCCYKSSLLTTEASEQLQHSVNIDQHRSSSCVLSWRQSRRYHPTLSWCQDSPQLLESVRSSLPLHHHQQVPTLHTRWSPPPQHQSGSTRSQERSRRQWSRCQWVCWRGYQARGGRRPASDPRHQSSASTIRNCDQHLQIFLKSVSWYVFICRLILK